jgi:hypothetical protein
LAALLLAVGRVQALSLPTPWSQKPSTTVGPPCMPTFRRPFSTRCDAHIHKEEETTSVTCRRTLFRKSFSTIASLTTVLTIGASTSRADDDEPYENPSMPPAPEERSGLVVLRVAEVAQFQEKILRAIANGDLPAEIIVSPMQIVFGTQILLRNSNLDGNMKLMIYNEIPKSSRGKAIKNAVRVMNTIQLISSTAAKVERPFTTGELLEIADLYRLVRVELNDMYEFMEPKEKEKYYAYFVAVTEYEKKIAEGTYNPDLDGVLQLEYDDYS